MVLTVIDTDLDCIAAADCIASWVDLASIASWADLAGIASRADLAEPASEVTSAAAGPLRATLVWEEGLLLDHTRPRCSCSHLQLQH